MDAEISELQRLIENLIRIGTVAEVDGDQIRVKRGNTTSNWIRWVAHRAGDTSKWSAPSIGEQAIMLAPGGDTSSAVAILGIYSDEFPAPSLSPSMHTTRYDDGAVIEYDTENHQLTATLPGGSAAIVSATSIRANADSIVANAPDTTCTGNLNVQGQLNVTGASNLNGGVNAKPGEGGGKAMTIDGSIDVADDLSVTGNLTVQGTSHLNGGVAS